MSLSLDKEHPFSINTYRFLSVYLPFNSITEPSIQVSVFANSDALIPRPLKSKMCGELGCTQCQYLCRGSLPLAAAACPCFALPTLFTVAGTLWSPHAHLQQQSELWTLKQMVFLPPLPFFFIMLPTFGVQGQDRGWNWLFECTVTLHSWDYRWTSSKATSFFCLGSVFLFSFVLWLSERRFISRVFI